MKGIIMKTFLDRFYDYVKSPEGFNCVKFQYEGITYQVVSGANISYVDDKGQKHRIELPDDVEVILNTKIGNERRTLRDIWSEAGENDLMPDFF